MHYSRETSSLISKNLSLSVVIKFSKIKLLEIMPGIDVQERMPRKRE